MSYVTIEALDEQGNPHEVIVARNALPKNGDWFEDEGQRLQRVPCASRVHVAHYSGIKCHGRPRLKDVEKHGFTRAPHYDEKGIACFDSRRQIDEYTAAVNDNPIEGRKLEWNPDGNE